MHHRQQQSTAHKCIAAGNDEPIFTRSSHHRRPGDLMQPGQRGRPGNSRQPGDPAQPNSDM